MPRRENRRRTAGLLAAGAAWVLVMAAASAGQGEALWLRDAVTAVSVPLQRAGAAAGRSTQDWLSRLFGRDGSEEETRLLRREAEALRGRVLELEEAALENRELKRLLRVREEHPGFSYAAAQVLGPDPDLGFAALLIDQGTESGVRAGDLVMTAAGLIGRVAEAGRYSAVVETPLHPRFRLGVYESGAGQTGVAAGSGSAAEAGQCALRYLAEEPEEGGMAATAGDGERVPRGIPVGRIREVRALDSGTGWEARLELFADPKEAAAVFVVTGLAGEAG